MNNYSDGERVYKKTLIHYIPAVLIPAITNIFLTLGLARILNLQLYGEYTYYTSIGVLITSIFSQWLVQSIQRFHYTDQKQKEYIFLVRFVQSIYIYTFLIAFIFYIFYKFLINSQDNILSILLSLTMLFTSQSLLAVKVAEYAANYKVSNIKKINVQQSFLKLVFLSIYLLIFHDFQINEIMIILSLTNFLNLLEFIRRNDKLSNVLIFNYSFFYSSKKIISKQFKKLLFYGLPMTGWFIGTNLLGVGDRVVLKLFTDSSQVGIYSANYTLVSTGIGLLVAPLLQAAHPVIMNYGQKNVNNYDDIAVFIEKLSRKYLVVSLFIVVSLFFYYKKISLLLFGSQYESGAVIIPLTILGIFFWNYSMYGHKGIELMNKPLKMMKYVLYSAFINLALNFILVPLMGITGSGIATLVAYISYAIFIKINSKEDIRWIINYKYIVILIIIYSLILLLLNPFINQILDYLIKFENK